MKGAETYKINFKKIIKQPLYEKKKILNSSLPCMNLVSTFKIHFCSVDNLHFKRRVALNITDFLDYPDLSPISFQIIQRENSQTNSIGKAFHRIDNNCISIKSTSLININ